MCIRDSLHELSLPERADGGVEPGEKPRDGGFACAGVAGEDHVQAQDVYKRQQARPLFS